MTKKNKTGLKKGKEIEHKWLSTHGKTCKKCNKKILSPYSYLTCLKEFFDRTGELLCLTCNKPMKPYKDEEYSWFCPNCSPHTVLCILRKNLEKDVKNTKGDLT